MYGDFARVTFDALKQRTRVLMQQGRVQLEADWNEQVAILLYLARTMMKDLVGPSGGPAGNCGFAIMTREWLRTSPQADDKRDLLQRFLKDAADFIIGSGHYYVDGILCDNCADVPYMMQPHCRRPSGEKPTMTNHAKYLAYLDVVEQSVFSVQDETLVEIALGFETAIRARQSWVVRTMPIETTGLACDDIKPTWRELVARWQSPHRGWMRFRAEPPGAASACNVSPDSKYRGIENQLYRVEIHRGGVCDAGKKGRGKGKAALESGEGGAPTFKYSRVNGSAVFAIENLNGNVAIVKGLRQDSRFGLGEGHWVELRDDSVLPGEAGPLRRVMGVDTYSREVTLDERTSGDDDIGRDASLHPYMRRWDQRAGNTQERGLRLDEGAAVIVLGEWMHLEDGLEVQFQPPDDPEGPVVFRSGDYWLGPARVATGGIIDWPERDGQPIAQPPHGVEHHYAPLAILEVANGELGVVSQCRREFQVPSKAVTR